MAREQGSLDEARARLPQMEAWVQAVLLRLDPLLPDRPLRVLEIGSAQGLALITLARAGHQASGVEPWVPAIETARALAEELHVSIDIREGYAEHLPFEDASFDLVVGFSVMEHVTDLRASLAEIARVTRKGGVFWFNSANALCPAQEEITGFPAFGWYPDDVKKAIMLWARDYAPEKVHYTKAPALHWWTPRRARRELGRVGFHSVQDRWQLRHPGEDRGARAVAMGVVKRSAVLRTVAEVLVSGCSFAAVRG